MGVTVDRAQGRSDYLTGNGPHSGACYGRAMITTTAFAPSTRHVGELLREWRQRRRMSQLDFATEAEISTRHLSFVETGRAQPSRDMVMKLAELLDVPLRERNELLVAAGFAPVFAARALDDPALQSARQAIGLVLKGHEPYPALAIDRHWNLVAANSMVGPLMAGASPELLQAPINVLRLTLHPQGLAPQVANLVQWREHLFARLRRQIEVSADAVLAALLKELTDYPAPLRTGREDLRTPGDVVVPFSLVSPAGTLNFISTTTVFGTPIDVTLSELAIEAFFPADEQTAQALRQMAA